MIAPRNFAASFFLRYRWLNLPGATLLALLQRTPALHMVEVADEMVASSPVGAVLRSSIAAAASLGAMNSLVGATTVVPVPSDNPATATVGQSFGVVFTCPNNGGSVAAYNIGGAPPPGLVFAGLNQSLTCTLSGTPTTPGSYSFSVQAIGPEGEQSVTLQYTVVVAASGPVAPPVFTTNPSTQTAVVGQNVSFTVAASGSPTYSWTGPAGVIAGATSSTLSLTNVQLSATGSYTATATNSAGSVMSAAATLTVTAAPAAPVFTTQPVNRTVTVGQSASFNAVASGSPTYAWEFGTTIISGATSGTLAITNAQVANAGSYTCIATNAVGSTNSVSVTLTVNTLAAPVFTVNPVAVTIATSHSAVFSVSASGSPTPTYQWNLNAAPISGATDPILQVSNAGQGNAGAYTCTATNSVGSVTSTSAGLTVTTTTNPGHLINLSARAAVGTGNNILIGGFGVQGTGTKQLLVRGVGPALSAFFTNDLAVPQLVMLDNSGAIVATNIGWGNAPVAGSSTASEAPTDATTNLMNSLGAYTIAPGSGDTAMVLTMPAGNNTAQISGVGATSGIALCEIYDADTGIPTARLINISARADVGTGNSILIGGFAISGATSETVLIRAVGPGLNDLLPGVFPLSAVLNQPVLTILNGTGTAIYSNTVWGGDATIAATFGTTGAFSLNPAHADSVVLASLPPGNYTAQVSGLNSGTGIALCEIYEVP